MTAYGLCECGCGQPTRISDKTERSLGHVLGQPRRFVQGHNGRTGQTNGHTRISQAGYVVRRVAGRPSGRKGTVGDAPEHVLIVERVLGKRLPRGAVVHHHDENRQNNAHSNLVVCQDNAYHRVLHRRMDALRACGHADWRKCWVCKQYDAVGNMRQRSNTGYWHPECGLIVSRRRNKGLSA